MTFGTNFYPYAFRKFVQIMIYSNKSGYANISIPYHEVFDEIDLNPGENLYNLTNPGDLDPYYLEIKRKGIYLRSSVEIKVFLINHGGSSTDGFFVYPLELLSTEYLVSTSKPLVHRPYTHFQAEMAVLSPYDGNHVTIHLMMSNGSIKYNNKTYHSGNRLNITLNAYETFQIYHPWDMSGTRIVSSKPIVVVSGNRCNVFDDYNGCDHFSEMLPPINKLSQNFIIPEFHEYFNWTVQIIAASGHTFVNFTEKDGENVTKTLKINEKLEVVPTNVATLEASKPVLVTQYVHGVHVTDRFDPFMVLCQGLDTFQKEYQIIVPGLGFESYLAMTVESREVKHLAIDGSLITDPLDLLDTTEVEFHGTMFTVVSVEVTPGAHIVNHKHGREFGLVVYGNQNHDSYGFLGGFTRGLQAGKMSSTANRWLDLFHFLG